MTYLGSLWIVLLNRWIQFPTLFCLFRLCQLKREDSESALLVDRDESEISKNFEMVRRESVKILLDKNFETRLSRSEHERRPDDTLNGTFKWAGVRKLAI